jgi:hypothetical protein
VPFSSLGYFTIGECTPADGRLFLKNDLGSSSDKSRLLNDGVLLLKPSVNLLNYFRTGAWWTRMCVRE